MDPFHVDAAVRAMGVSIAVTWLLWMLLKLREKPA